DVEREAGRVRMSGIERREQLINVARHLFAEKGYEAVSVNKCLATLINCSLLSIPLIRTRPASRSTSNAAFAILSLALTFSFCIFSCALSNFLAAFNSSFVGSLVELVGTTQRYLP
ncbi:MAG: hypothetical protein ACKPKO_60685, partial [Candidatus Fonsibacter sp.]